MKVRRYRSCRCSLLEASPGSLLVCGHFAAPETKKADVMEHPKAFDHVGLLVNEPPGVAGLLSI